jgi:hypothetical protein
VAQNLQDLTDQVNAPVEEKPIEWHLFDEVYTRKEVHAQTLQKTYDHDKIIRDLNEKNEGRFGEVCNRISELEDFKKLSTEMIKDLEHKIDNTKTQIVNLTLVTKEA